MEIVQKIDCKTQIRATLAEDGELSVTMSATAVYDKNKGSYTTARVEVPAAEKKKLKKALEEAMAACAPQIPAKIVDAISVSRQVAKRHGEMK